MWKWKVFDPKSWAALLSSLARLKGMADENTSAISGLGEDFARLSELTAKDVAGKQDKPKGTSCTIPATGWEKDETETYPNYYDMPMIGVTAKDRVEITLAPAGFDAAAECGLCPTCESLAGKVRLRAASVPSAAIAAEYWIEQGKE